ncbi:MAG: glycosyltransferase family 2 protein [Bacteroidetes bacterium]|nr:glycosyltransferase family 2 protein [Bacteroidota bacterium]
MIQFLVVIPLYNKENFIKKTLESVLSQTYTQFEIIIVDDGSSDNSLSVVGELIDSRIRIFTQENRGVSAARNFGIEKAKNEYIAFLDADDLWLPDYLETIKCMIEQYPQAGVFATGYTICSSKNYDVISNRIPKGETILINNYCKSIIDKEMVQIWTGAVCVKKSIFSQTDNFRVNVKKGEDLDMWLRVSMVSPVIWKNEPKALYFLETENNAMEGYKGKYFSYKDFFPYWEWCTYSSSIYLKKYARILILERMKSAYKHKKWNDFVIIFFKLMKTL